MKIQAENGAASFSGTVPATYIQRLLIPVHLAVSRPGMPQPTKWTSLGPPLPWKTSYAAGVANYSCLARAHSTLQSSSRPLESENMHTVTACI